MEERGSIHFVVVGILVVVMVVVLVVSLGRMQKRLGRNKNENYELFSAPECADMTDAERRASSRCLIEPPHVTMGQTCVDGVCLDVNDLKNFKNLSTDVGGQQSDISRGFHEILDELDEMAGKRKARVAALNERLYDVKNTLNSASKVEAEGGDITLERDGFRYHVFFMPTSVRSLKVANEGVAEVFVVGGGGGGGGGGPMAYDPAGGGGGGEVLHLRGHKLERGSYPVQVGAGGSAGGRRQFGKPGRESRLGSLRVNGGGGGARGRSDGLANESCTGGSGGGSGRGWRSFSPGDSRHGNNGGNSVKLHPQGLGNAGGPNTSDGGGGGGATRAGRVLHGGEGYLLNMGGFRHVFGSGGGGGRRGGTIGKGGTNAGDGGGTGKPGMMLTGSGGGGGEARGRGEHSGGAGGSGIVVVRYHVGARLIQGPEMKLEENYMGTFRTSRFYRLSFEIKPTGTVRDWGSIIRFSREKDEDYPRLPAIWFHPGTTRLHVKSSTVKDMNPGPNTSGLSMNSWHKVVVEVKRSEDSIANHQLRVYIDGKLDREEKRTVEPYAAGDRHLYLGTRQNNKYDIADASVRDVEYLSLEDTTPAAVFFEHANYAGKMWVLQPEERDYNLTDMRRAGFRNDSLTSVFVGPGYEATLYQHNFSGSSRRLTKSSPHLGSMNDTVSSVRIRRV